MEPTHISQLVVGLTIPQLETLLRKCVRDELGEREEESWLTLSECAQLMRLSTKTVLKRIKEDALPAEREGRDWRFQKSRVVAFMKGER
jgi:excisionase family DNA binding protein